MQPTRNPNRPTKAQRRRNREHKQPQQKLNHLETGANINSLIVEAVVFLKAMLGQPATPGFQYFGASTMLIGFIELLKTFAPNKTLGERLMSGGRAGITALINTAVFLETSLVNKIHIFTVPLAMNGIITVLEAYRQKTKLSAEDKIKLALIAVQLVGVITAIYDKGEGNTFDRIEAGQKPVLEQAIACGAAGAAMLLRVCNTLYQPAKTLFFKPAEVKDEIDEQKKGLLTVNSSTAPYSDGSAAQTPVHVV